jgi:choline dehydrogenase-like flavoprotein
MSLRKFDLIVVGTGFASSFFLERFLRRSAADTRVLVLERGARRDHRWQLDNPGFLDQESRHTFVRRGSRKDWRVAIAFGGASNCWWACTPRMLPTDFELRSRYGIGRDWPLSYDDLEEYYCDAEEMMQVSGDSESSPAPRSRPYPQPPHRLTACDEKLMMAFAGKFTAQPTARPRRSTLRRPACCGNGVCTLCPIDSKFTILNEMSHVFADQRVVLELEAIVTGIETNGGRVSGVRYERDGREHCVGGDLVALGANGIFNPHILLRSGLDEGGVGKGLVEQVSHEVVVYLDGMDGYGGSTSITGHGYMLYDGDHRKNRAACLIETLNIPTLRDEPGRWREVLILKAIYEDLRRVDNYVAFDPIDLRRPILHFSGRSDYARRGIDRLAYDLQQVLAPLPVEGVKISPAPNLTEAHIIGTTVMGKDPADSVVDDGLQHHRLRGLLVLGSGAFPTAAPANPTLTLCALSLRAADRLFRGAR